MREQFLRERHAAVHFLAGVLNPPLLAYSFIQHLNIAPSEESTSGKVNSLAAAFVFLMISPAFYSRHSRAEHSVK